MIPAVSIVLCTRNRSDELRQTLAALEMVCVPRSMRVELVVVDNASTDSTQQLVKSYRPANLLVRYVTEPHPGKGYAYNTGIGAAQGEALLFTDDDVRPPEDWIAGMCQPILDKEADAVAGGVVIPDYLRPLAAVAPWWFASTETMVEEPFVRLVGANMAFGRHVLERVPAFDVELGPGALGFHDETLFSMQLLQAGYKIQAAFEVAVEHHFDASRASRRGLLGTAARMGRCDAYVHYHWLHIDHSWTRLQRSRSTLGLAARRGFSWRSCLVRGQVARWEIERVKANAYMDQYDKERRRSRNYSKRGLEKLASSTRIGSESKCP